MSRTHVKPAYRSRIDTRLAAMLLRLPDSIINRLVGAPPVEVDGRTLNRRIQLLLMLSEKLNMRLSIEDASVEERRKELAKSAKLGMPLLQGIDVTNRTFQGPGGPVPVRLYRSFGMTGTCPAIVFYHGGGWAAGDIDTHDGCSRVLAAESGCLVVSVGYRLAPEHPFPAGVDDAVAAYRWVHENAEALSVDAGRIGVMGDSAGGNLAAVVACEMADSDIAAPVAQCLVYPATDMHFTTRSHDLFASGFFLDRASVEWYRAQYLPNEEDWNSPRAAPLLHKDLSAVAPAHVVTAGFDPLRDEGRMYAERLAEAGVEVRYRCYDDMVHGFFGMGVLPDGIARIQEICATMGEMMHSLR